MNYAATVQTRLSHSLLLLLLLNLLSTPAIAQSKKHYFPQIADGKFLDGTYYKSKLSIRQWLTSSDPITCSFRLWGMTTDLASAGVSSLFSITIPDKGFFVGGTPGTQSFQSGYGVLNCAEYVYATVLYSFYSATGTKLSEATVFSSEEGSWHTKLIVDQTENARLGVAIANDTDLSRTYTITLTNSSGDERSNGSLTVPARTATAKFIDEILTIPIQTGLLTINSPDYVDFSVVGLRYTGPVFTTIPAN